MSVMKEYKARDKQSFYSVNKQKKFDKIAFAVFIGITVGLYVVDTILVCIG